MGNQQTVNRKHKDGLFRMIFNDREALLSLFNAVNNSDYTDPEAITINTIEDVVYMGMKNDNSFLIANYLNLYEAQSTWNPNMPLRGVFYFASLFRGYVAQNRLDIYSETLILLPIPQYLVFYNGTTDIGERVTRRLSDSFLYGTADPALECVVTYLNINYGHNQEIMSKCRKLYEYAYLIEQIRAGVRAGKPIGTAVDDAVQQCISDGILADFLRRHRAEVNDVILAEYDKELHIRNTWEEGMKRGEKRAQTRFVRNLLQKGGFSDNELAELAELPLEKVLEIKRSCSL